VKDNNGQTPLYWAAESGHEAIAKLLLATANIDINQQDFCGQTRFDSSCVFQQPLSC